MIFNIARYISGLFYLRADCLAIIGSEASPVISWFCMHVETLGSYATYIIFMQHAKLDLLDAPIIIQHIWNISNAIFVISPKISVTEK